MTAKFAEYCREKDKHLIFNDDEYKIFWRNNPPIDAKTCKRDAFLGLFFDGTNNNKYRDLSGRFTNSASNVARLFEAFSGNVAELKPTYGGKPDKALLAGVADGNYKFTARSISGGETPRTQWLTPPSLRIASKAN